MSDTWLSPDEVVELTARTRWSAQCRALASMGVPFRPNAVGRPLVERSAVCKQQDQSKPRRKRGPNMEALHGKAA